MSWRGAREVAEQERALRRIAKRFRAVWGGAENGRRGYTLTFAIGYIRDFMSEYGLIGESFETSVPWIASRRCAALSNARWPPNAPPRRDRHAVSVVPRDADLPCRRLRLLHDGLLRHAARRSPGDFEDIEHKLRQVVLDNGGSLSHHHGVGKIRQAFLPQVHSAAGLELIRAAKRAVDPSNVFGIGNGACGR